MITDVILEDRLAIVGTTGSGKTFAAKGMAEALIAGGARACVVDPLGVWWGLRAGPDGDPAGGLPVTIFGGLHGDIPITDQDGRALARILADSDLRCIVDVSELGSGAARRRFMSAFAEALYDANRRPLHLILDEADLWAPQRPLPDQTALQGKIGEIVRRGRVRGFVPWLITQRPAVLDKDVLSQADTLIAMKLTSSQDRNAIGAWIEGQADRAEGKLMLAKLPRLPVGTGLVWSPGHDVLQQVSFPGIATFDSSKTPARGERVAARSLAPVDVSAIGALLAAERQERPAEKRGARHDADAIAAAEGRGYQRGRDEAAAEIIALREKIREMQTAIDGALGLLAAHVRREDGIGVIDVRRPEPPTIEARPARDTMPRGRGTGAELRILRVLAQRHPARLTVAQWATLAGMSRRGGTWGTYVSRLRVAGLLDESGGTVACTTAGLDVAGAQPAQPLTSSDVRAMWRNALGAGPNRLIDILLRHPTGLRRDGLAAEANMAPGGGTFGTYLSRLRTNGLIHVNGHQVTLAEELRDA
ncbi:MAG: hypothetical protein WDN25_13130 [Acetobacteraceae bacterium]